MQEPQQETGMATPTDQPSTASPSTNQPAPNRKPNRHARRAMLALQVRGQKLAARASKDRLQKFNKLTTWKDREALRKNRMSDEQIASVFRVALDRIFKGKEIVRKREKVSFDEQLRAIIVNVKRGMKYKSDVAPAAAPATETAAPPSGDGDAD